MIIYIYKKMTTMKISRGLKKVRPLLHTGVILHNLDDVKPINPNTPRDGVGALSLPSPFGQAGGGAR
jgi:hypothetical protein